MSVVAERSLHLVDEKTVQPGVVFEGSIGDLVAIARNRNNETTWYAFFRNSSSRDLKNAGRELDDTKEIPGNEGLVLGVGIGSVTLERVTYDHQHLGFWNRVDESIWAANSQIVKDLRLDGQIEQESATRFRLLDPSYLETDYATRNSIDVHHPDWIEDLPF